MNREEAKSLAMQMGTIIRDYREREGDVRAGFLDQMLRTMYFNVQLMKMIDDRMKLHPEAEQNDLVQLLKTLMGVDYDYESVYKYKKLIDQFGKLGMFIQELPRMNVDQITQKDDVCAPFFESFGKGINLIEEQILRDLLARERSKT